MILRMKKKVHSSMAYITACYEIIVHYEIIIYYGIIWAMESLHPLLGPAYNFWCVVKLLARPPTDLCCTHFMDYTTSWSESSFHGLVYYLVIGVISLYSMFHIWIDMFLFMKINHSTRVVNVFRHAYIIIYVKKRFLS